jgi:ribosomal protein S18 acetylase RimI-like enzyme
VAPLETAAATAAAPLTAAAESRGDLAAAAAADEGSNLLEVTVRPVSGLLELRQVARLRAEAYYADDRSRFAESFKRQFASQEVDSLQHRTAPRGPGRAPQCDCLVAVDGAGLVAGCIDVRVPQAETGLPASGVPAGEPRGVYILNVVVAEHQRGRGVGRQLMRAAMARAVRVWGATRLFTHVEAGNDVASGLYRGCGFSEHSGSGALEGATTLGGCYRRSTRTGCWVIAWWRYCSVGPQPPWRSQSRASDSSGRGCVPARPPWHTKCASLCVPLPAPRHTCRPPAAASGGGRCRGHQRAQRRRPCPRTSGLMQRTAQCAHDSAGSPPAAAFGRAWPVLPPPARAPGLNTLTCAHARAPPAASRGAAARPLCTSSGPVT